MRKLVQSVLIYSCLISLQVGATPDIILDSSLDYDWSSVLVKKTRRLMENYKLDDPFKGRIDTPLVIADDILSSHFNQSTKDYISSIGEAIGLSINSGRLKIEMRGFQYDIQNFKLNLIGLEDHPQGSVVKSSYSSDYVDLIADEIIFSLEMPTSTGKHIPLIKAVIKKPKLIMSKNQMLEFYAEFLLEDKKEFHQIKLLETDFSPLESFLRTGANDIGLDYEALDVSDISLNLGKRTYSIKGSHVQKVLLDRKDEFKRIIFSQMSHLIKNGTGRFLLGLFEQYKIPKEYWLDSQYLKSQIILKSIKDSLNGENHVEINLPADFCPNILFSKQGKDCIQNKVTKPNIRIFSESMTNNSIQEIKNIFNSRQANIVASISETYVNKLLASTIDAGLWDSSLKSSKVILGDKKAFIRFSESNENAKLYMDLIYRPNKFKAFLIDNKEVRFPLELDVALKITKGANNVPLISIIVTGANLKDDDLLYGIKKEQMISTIFTQSRLRKMVVKKIKTSVLPMVGKEMISLSMDELKGLGLETIKLKSDANGRMNILMQLDDLINAD